MISDWKRRRAARKIKPGDGHALQRFRWWQVLSRALFQLRLTGENGEREVWSVDVRSEGDQNGVVWAQLYRDGRHQAKSKLPAEFSVPGGTVQVVASGFGLKRCHFVANDGAERPLVPDPVSAAGRRAQLDRASPALSRGIGALSIVILIVGVVLGVPQIAEQVTAFPPVAERIGTFISPIQLPAWFNIGLLIATLLASTERGLRLRYHWLLDGGLFGAED